MKKIFALSVLLIFIFAIQAFPCFSPTDMFAVEVVLNKPGASADLGPIRLADNVTFEDPVFIYRSHYDKQVAVILQEINEMDVLKGLSVRIQIPTKNVMVMHIATDLAFETEDSVMDKIDKDFLTSLGYLIDVYSNAGDEKPGAPASVILSKEDIIVSIVEETGDNVSRVTFRAEVVGQDSLSDKIKEEFRSILASLGVGKDVQSKVGESVTKIQEGDLAEAVDVDKDSFDFKSAMKIELDWLKTNQIIFGLDESDFAKIVETSQAGLAGWNSRIIYEKEKWISYAESTNPMLVRAKGCGGFAIEKMAFDETITLQDAASVTAKGKLATIWGRAKKGL